jgi:hypothetical protein
MTTYRYTVTWTTTSDSDFDLVGPGVVAHEVGQTVRRLMRVETGVRVEVHQVDPDQPAEQTDAAPQLGHIVDLAYHDTSGDPRA